MPLDPIRLWDVPECAFRGEPPTLTPYPRGETPAPAVLVLPGGGYQHLADHEGPHVARWLNQQGFTAAVLRYRRAPDRHPAPIHDAQRAMRLMRRHATDWGINAEAIAVMGFSAGGHLATTLAVHPDAFAETPDDAVPMEQVQACRDVPARPDAVVLAYPVIDLHDPLAHAGSRQNLLGDAPDPVWLDRLSTDRHVTPGTPPCFLWHTADDAAVPVGNSLRFAQACADQGVPVELHVHPHGRHGLGLADTGLTPNAHPAHVWPGLAAAFLHRVLTPR